MNGVINWIRQSQSPALVSVRNVVRRHPVLRKSAAGIHGAIHYAALRIADLKEHLWPSLSPQIRAFFAARRLGGALSLADFDAVWTGAGKASSVLCIADDPEQGQIALLLARQGTTKPTLHATFDPGRHEPRYLARFELIIVGSSAAMLEQVSRAAAGGPVVLGVGLDPSARSTYREPARSLPRKMPVSGSVRERLDRGEPIRVVMLNDIGLRFGAGIAQRRQAASLLLNGWEVAVVAHDPGRDLAPPAVTGVRRFPNWRGVSKVRRVAPFASAERVAANVAASVHALRPDVVIVGNIHGAEWPMSIMPALQASGAQVLAFMHDAYFVTGRCAQPGDCRLYQTGCDARCPTPHEYPRLEPAKIAPAWRDRAAAFAGSSGAPLVGNSDWTRSLVVERFGDAVRSARVHLALDECLFAPQDKAVARDLLGLPPDQVVILMGAVDIDNQWKGGPLFQTVCERLMDRTDVTVALFGRSSKERFPDAVPFGLVQDERLMAMLFNAADIFVSTGTAESFGQTLLEASACGVPAVAFRVGGVPDVIVHAQTGLLVDQISANDLLQAVERLIGDAALRADLGRNARARVLEKFSLARQSEAWVECLKRLC